MVCVGVASELDAKIVDDMREHYGQVGVCPDCLRAGDGGITVLGEMKSEAAVGKDAGLLQARHAFSDIKVDPAVRGNLQEGCTAR